MSAKEFTNPPPAASNGDYIGAIRLALESTADLEAEHKVIEEILKQAPDTPGEALWPTKILIDAIRAVNGIVNVT